MSEKILECLQVSKTYKQGECDVVALKSVNLRLNAGEFTALIGPSGSGKSTLLNICGLIDSPSIGEVHFLGENLNTQSVANQQRLTQLRRDKMGFIFQGFNLVPVMTLFENVEYPLTLTNLTSKQRKQTVMDMLERVGIAQYSKL